MTPFLIDTHAHIYLTKKPPDEIIESALKNNVKKMIVPGVDIKSSFKAGELSQRYPGIVFAAFGIHPSENIAIESSELLEMAKKFPFKAIGEIGLDYYHMDFPKEKQIALFEQQLDLATSLHLPVIIHNRHSDDDMASVLARYPDVPKLMHCYSSDIDFARKIDTEHTLFSFAGQITYSKKGKVIRTIKELPIEKIVIETDCPYLTPKAYKGQENQPAYIIESARKIAEVKDLSVEKVIDVTSSNAMRFFNLS